MIYVDELRSYYDKREWSHMTADTIPELHAFAQSIGVKRCWFHNPRHHNMPHYDLNPTQRERAVLAGAVEEGFRERARRLGKI